MSQGNQGGVVENLSDTQTDFQKRKMTLSYESIPCTSLFKNQSTLLVRHPASYSVLQ